MHHRTTGPSSREESVAFTCLCCIGMRALCTTRCLKTERGTEICRLSSARHVDDTRVSAGVNIFWITNLLCTTFACVPTRAPRSIVF